MMEKSREELEREHSQSMNDEAIERIKKETMSQAEADRIEGVFFEDDEEITLRDGKKYRIPPSTLKEARRLMKLLRTVNVDAIILNFLPTDDDEVDNEREDGLFELLGIAFKGYPHVDRDYIDNNVDIEIARKIIDILIGLNGLKK